MSSITVSILRQLMWGIKTTPDIASRRSEDEAGYARCNSDEKPIALDYHNRRTGTMPLAG
ncbi:hypothetical protein QM999_00085 [Pectobacterium cacticida]|uniref:hypothetical protein n=1 Tax=Pectobacterium cacticida TaxID=69221 RepID=UPI002FF1B4E5